MVSITLQLDLDERKTEVGKQEMSYDPTAKLSSYDDSDAMKGVSFEDKRSLEDVDFDSA